ncbi:MAG: T9SS type A sorting domain-containing protein [Candidatus Cloacimonadota bacterium]|nr:T9SS type A sorting domain-containing protein [Candidatus Cloacimonadota bacterium]
MKKHFQIIALLLLLLYLTPIMIYGKSSHLKIKKPTTEAMKSVEAHSKKIKKLPKPIFDKFYSHKRKSPEQKRLSGDIDVNLLVLLIDFVPDDDPKTTGNGKFDFGKWDYFEINNVIDSIRTICSPPHDSSFYHQTMVAMQYYYQTASLGVLNSFDPAHEINFHFKIYPNQADTAYSMPHKMAYYFPDTPDWDLKNERLIQSFKDAITTADTTDFANTPDINFSDYKQIMIIHAGADWQHDIFGDSPCNLPAMYVELEDDSVAVNDGTKYIKAAAFSPETISQDFYKSDSYIFGFGSVTAEMFHEFGHSIGFVDLYNTTNMYPAVGYWDIMDSGGSASAITIDSTETSVDTLVIEGALPILPSAWSRLLIWGNELENLGKVTTLTSPSTGNITIDAAELPDAENAQFIKIPINDKEYFLIENRETDLNGNGAPVIKLYSDSIKVPMYPINGETDELSYEYDYMLPTYDAFKQSYTNGGLCIWHIDDYVIYDEIVTSGGQTYSRFEANRVNGNYSRRGVKLVEADGIEDIGNPYSYYPYGTCYEPFFRIKAGQWSPSDPDRIHNFRFAPDTEPNTFSNDDANSHIEIFDISHYGTSMDFRFQYHLCDEILSIKLTEKYNPSNEILVFNEPYYHSRNIVLTYGTYSDGNESKIKIYNDLFGEFSQTFPKEIKFPLSLLQNDNESKIIVPFEDSLAILNFQLNEQPVLSQFGSSINKMMSDSPIPISADKIAVPTENSLSIYKLTNNTLTLLKEIDQSTNKIAFNESKQQIIAIHSPQNVAVYDTSLTWFDEFTLPVEFGDYYPIVENTENSQNIFVQDKFGSVYKFDGSLDKIFDCENFPSDEISNISIGDVNDNGIHDIIFTVENTVYAITGSGSLVSGYPQSIYESNYSSDLNSIVGHDLLANEISLILSTDNNFTQSISQNAEYDPLYSYAYGKSISSPYLNLRENSYDLIIAEGDSILNIISFNDIPADSKIYWNGYKNGPDRASCCNVMAEGLPDSVNALSIIAFPNPAEEGYVHIRIQSPNDASASIKIFNLAADLLFENDMSVFANEEKEFKWNIQNITSGVYFAKVKVGNSSKLLKIGVIK